MNRVKRVPKLELTPFYSELPPFTLTLALVLAVVCMVTDLRHRRIPNVFTFPAALLGLGLGFWHGGWGGLLNSLYGLAAGFALMIIPYYVGGMGAGDVKLMAALGALIGFPVIVQVFLYTALIGGVMALIVAVSKRAVGRTLRNIATWTRSLVLMRLGGVKPHLDEAELAKSAGTLPYAVAIALGLVAHMFLGDLI